MILVIDCGSSKVPEFVKVYDKLGVETLVVNFEDWREAYNQYKFSGVIISGAPKLLTQEAHEPYLQIFDGIDALEIPVLGVCFGHQIIGLLNGSEVYLCNEDRNWQSIVLKSIDCPLLAGLPTETLKMMQDHTEAITLANNFQLVGSSSVCEVEIVQNLDRKIFGVQFHPEVSEQQGEQLLKNFAYISGILKD